MLKGPCNDVNIGSIDALISANLNIVKLNEVYRELWSALLFLKGNKKFSNFFMSQTRMPIRVEMAKIEKVALEKLNELYVDYNTFLDHIGYYSSVERPKELPISPADISENPYFTMLEDNLLSEEDKFLSLSAYFHVKLDGINHLTEKIGTSWRDEQFDEYNNRFYECVNFSLGKYPKLFKDYGKSCANHEKVGASDRSK